jgi:hypothetical protein
MKIIFIIISIIISASAFAENIFRDENHFVICLKTDSKTYFFDWDHFIQTPQKNVNYFERADFNRSGAGHLRNCDDQKYIRKIPSEILHSVEEIKTELPEEVLFSIQQVSEGASIFRNEKTAIDYISNRSSEFQIDHPEILTKLRSEVGDRFSSEVMNEFMNKIIVKNNSCAEFIGTCDFYLCQEQKYPCGLDGYNLHFGYKYCSDSKFGLLQKMKTREGQNWTRSVYTCLQKRSLENSEKILESENKCRDLQQASYNSHVDCYFEAGFCDLKLTEKEKIFNLIKKEIFSSQSIKQGLDLLKRCSDQNEKKEELK